MGTIGDSDFKAFEAAGWSAAADRYEDGLGAVTAQVVEPLLDAARVAEGTLLLDVACGTGGLAAAALARGARPTGADISEGMLERARERCPGVEFHASDAERLPFADGSFQAVTAAFLLNHVPSPPRAAAELARACAPGGTVAVAVWDAPERVRFLEIVGEAAAMAGSERPGELDQGPDQYRYADPAKLRELLLDAGLEPRGDSVVDVSLTVTGTDELLAAVAGSSVRTAALVRAQDEETRKRIAAELGALCESHRDGDGLCLPGRVRLATALRPS